jgi:hypothetical protein
MLSGSIGKARRAGGGGGSDRSGEQSMTREQALRALGLQPDATDAQIDAALARSAKSEDRGLNGSDHAIAARIDEARDILRGKESS